jgi:hypothetical protein
MQRVARAPAGANLTVAGEFLPPVSASALLPKLDQLPVLPVHLPVLKVEEFLALDTNLSNKTAGATMRPVEI